MHFEIFFHVYWPNSTNIRRQSFEHCQKVVKQFADELIACPLLTVMVSMIQVVKKLEEKKVCTNPEIESPKLIFQIEDREQPDQFHLFCFVEQYYWQVTLFDPNTAKHMFYDMFHEFLKLIHHEVWTIVEERQQEC